MSHIESETVTRGIHFPKELKEYLDKTAKKERRTFIAEVVYRLEKQIEGERNAEKPVSN